MDRRSFLVLGAKTAAGLILARAVPAQARILFRTSKHRPKNTSRNLAFYHTHTDECLEITYARNGMYDLKALRQINRYLRDFRTDEIYPIDPNVLNILWEIQKKLGGSTYEIISGYRSPKTNQTLRGRSKGVAKRSLHMRGKALDIRLTGKRTRTVRDCAVSLQCGGVGYYAKSDFVHIDTGRIRTW